MKLKREPKLVGTLASKLERIAAAFCVNHRLICSPHARGRMRKLGDLNQTIAYAMLKTSCGEFEEAFALLEPVRRKKPLDTQIRLALMNVRQLSGDFSPPQ